MVTVMVVPRFDSARPRWPSPDRLFLRTVCDYLDIRRLVTTELYVRGPVYLDTYVTIGIATAAGWFPDLVRQAVRNRMYEYLSSLPPAARRAAAGSSSRTILKKDLEAVATRVPGVAFVRSIRLGVTSGEDVDTYALVRARAAAAPEHQRRRGRGRAVGLGDRGRRRRARRCARCRSPSTRRRAERWTSTAPASIWSSASPTGWGALRTSSPMAVPRSRGIRRRRPSRSRADPVPVPSGSGRARHSCPRTGAAPRRTGTATGTGSRGTPRRSCGARPAAGPGRSGTARRAHDTGPGRRIRAGHDGADAGPRRARRPRRHRSPLPRGGRRDRPRPPACSTSTPAARPLEMRVPARRPVHAVRPVRRPGRRRHGSSTASTGRTGGSTGSSGRSRPLASWSRSSQARRRAFHAVGGADVVRPGRSFPRGFALDAVDPVAIEALPDGSVLVLDRIDGIGPSSLLRYRLEDKLGDAIPITASMEIDAGDGSRPDELSVAAHDIAFISDHGTDGAGTGRLVRGRRSRRAGDRVRPRLRRRRPPRLTVRLDFLPMHAFGGRALGRRPGDRRRRAGPVVRREGRRPHRRRCDALVRCSRRSTSRAMPARAASSSPHRDGRALSRRCWTAGRPTARGTGCSSTRASRPARPCGPGPGRRTSSTSWSALPFLAEPAPYLRPAGAELPFYAPFGPPAEGGTGRQGLGTWETLFQAARGRYLQVRLDARGRRPGNAGAPGRARLLPAGLVRGSATCPPSTRTTRGSAAFTERWLANIEGFNTEIEGRIAFASRLFDPRTAPPETLDWLAGWVGLLVDPVWARIQARRAAGRRDGVAPGVHGMAAGRPAPDRRRLFIRFARKLYERRGTLEGIRFALHPAAGPVPRGDARGVPPRRRPSVTVRSATSSGGTACRCPTPASREDELEDLLYAYVLAPDPPVEGAASSSSSRHATGGPSRWAT